jgi:hypothetical protein
MKPPEHAAAIGRSILRSHESIISLPSYRDGWHEPKELPSGTFVAARRAPFLRIASNMTPRAASFTLTLAALESEWRDIVREHGDLSAQPYDVERNTRHEVRLLRYKASWEHMVAALIGDSEDASDTDNRDILTLQ